MHVAEAGEAEPLLLLHGYPQHWWEWRHLIPAFSERYRVICPDLRGAGWTDAPRSGYKADQLVADVVSLLDELGLDSALIVAHDWGALVGFLLCLDHPECVKRYVSLAIPHPFVKFHPRLLAAVPRLWFQPAIATPFIVPLFPRVIAGRYRNRRLRTPTLILYGSEDPNMRPEILGGHEDLADDLVLECVEGASHFIADEKPDVVIARVTQFLARE